MRKFVIFVIILIVVFINLYCMGLKSEERRSADPIISAEEAQEKNNAVEMTIVENEEVAEEIEEQPKDVVEVKSDPIKKEEQATSEKKVNVSKSTDKVVKKVDTKIEKQDKTEIVETKTEEKKQENKVAEEVKQETKTEEKREEGYTEQVVTIAEKKECEGNKHGMNVGNTGMWFNTKDEAISTYKAEIKKWGDLWTDKENPISNEEYYKNCPYGYEIWSCPYCGKWTLNYYLDN